MKAWRAVGAASLLAASVFGCGGAAAGGKGAQTGREPAAGAGAEVAHLEVRTLAGRPALLVLSRDGDSRAALSAVVAVDAGPVAATALAALVEARLSAAGVAGVDTTADRDAYRLRVLLESRADLGKTLAAVQTAMTAPLAEEPLARKLIVARVGALRARMLDGEAAAAVARCTSELGVTPAEAAIEPLANVETWRREAHGTATVALGVVGTDELASAAASELEKLSAWPATTRGAGDASATRSGTHVEPGARRGTASLAVAVRTPDRGAALALATEIGAAGSALAARLSALPVPFRLRRVATTLRATGACVLVEAVAEPGRAPIEPSAAAAATLIHREVAGAPPADDDAEAARHIRALGDPRDAAAAAARWALSRAGTGAAASSASLGVAPSASVRSGEADDADSTRFAEIVARALAAPAPIVEERVRAERGQGETWVLVGSPCPVVEDTGEAGLTALAMLRAARQGDGRDGVAVEPWVAPDGAGLLAHAAPRAGETPRATAARVADVASRALYGAAPGASAFVDARATLLARLEAGGDRSRAPLVAAAAPGFASQLAPWGLFESVARSGATAVDLRREALLAGPARVAVLSQESLADASVASRAVARWLPARDGAGRCAAGAVGALATGVVRAQEGAPRGHAWVAVPVDASAAGAASASATALALGGDAGLLDRALEATSVHGSAYLLGAGARSVLVVELRGDPARLEAGVGQVRALFGRLAQGAATPADLVRASARYASSDIAGRLDPRRRAIDLFRGTTAVPAPDAAEWRAWLAASLRDDRVTVVLPPPAK